MGHWPEIHMLARCNEASERQQAVPETAQVEACFQRALTIACRQQAKSWELRAATSLSQLRQQEKRAKAHTLLAEVYDWFTERFDTADVREARRLLADLGSVR
jgi:predicted ATPase